VDWEHDGPEGTLRARPQDHFSVEYLWEDGTLRQSFQLKYAEEVPERVLPARTFILYRDWKIFSAEPDLLAGAQAGSGLLLASTAGEFAEARANLPESRGTAFPLVHPEAFRLEDEPARHKVLDLLGDLALNGLALPKLRLTVRNGGHALNHLLLNQLQQERLQ
jgi:UDP-3-O-acyl-N-acetylglucosamine deacetylase